MARKLPQLQRALDAPALASVAYGEIASSIYFALGVIALHALGFTPIVLGVVGLLFLIVALSYAEGTAVDSRNGRRRNVRSRGVQRPRRVPHRLGALPRLPDRDRAIRAVRAPLSRARARHRHDREAPGRRHRGVRRRCRHRSGSSASTHEALHVRSRRSHPRPRDAGAARHLRLRDPLLRQRADA